jgi:tight adherence protein C
MSLLAVMVAGAGIGLGVVVGYRALFPRPVPLEKALTDLARPRRSPMEPDTVSPTSGVKGRVGQTVVRVLESTGLVDLGGLERRLRTLGKPIQAHAFEKLLGGIAGFLLPIMFSVMLTAAGMSMSPVVTAVLAIGLSVAGFMYPDLGLSEQIQRRRRDFRYSLSAYLDLVTIILAGGGGLETALQTSADLGDGWAFAEIRTALRRARLTGQTPWDVFDDLGGELGIDELRELAAAAHLAGNQGARIRASLTAKADSMRASQTDAIEAQAEAATEKMLLPVVTLVVGMILFIGFGVIQAISTPGTVP